MRDKLDAESRKARVDYRLERAFDTLKEADYNTEGGYYNAAVNVSSQKMAIDINPYLRCESK